MENGRHVRGGRGRASRRWKAGNICQQKPYWATNTYSRFDVDRKSVLRLQDDGNLVLMNERGEIRWQTREQLNILSTEVKPGRRLTATDTIVSENGQYRATVQYDGDLIIFRKWPAPGAIVWWAGTRNQWKKELYFNFESDGNLVHERVVEYSESGPFDRGTAMPSVMFKAFETRTAGKAVTSLALSDGGQLQLRKANGSVVWASNSLDRSFCTRLEAGVIWDRNSYLESPSGGYRAYLEPKYRQGAFISSITIFTGN